jgi:hypothetical protein
LIAGFSQYQYEYSITFILKRLALFQLGRKAYSNEQMNSILGPLLFLVYINDLPYHISDGEVVPFAYDTNILVADKNINTLEEKIGEVMIQLESWFAKNNLIINTNKTKAMLFQLNKSYYMSEPVITFKNMKISYTSQFKFLGVNITNNLK